MNSFICQEIPTPIVQELAMHEYQSDGGPNIRTYYKQHGAMLKSEHMK